MRHPVAPAALALLLACAPAFAQVGADRRFVSATEAEVRSGPSTSSNFYVTNRLRRGQPVEVIQDLGNGWLKILPPEGSFSYINTRFLRHIVPNQPNYVVALEGGEVPVLIGSEFVNDHRPTVVGVKLKPGAQVVSIGKTQEDTDGSWMPIEPPPGEGRYLRADSVAPAPPLPGAILTSAGVSASSATARGPLVPSQAPSANLPPTPEALWQQARQAEASGQRAEAIRLFLQVCTEASQSNPTLAKWALDWAHYLQSGHAGYGVTVGVPSPAYAGQTYPLTAEETSVRLNPPPGARAVWADPRGNATEGTIPRATPAARSVFTSGGAAAAPADWVQYRGRLRQAGRAVEGQKTYVLEMEVAGYQRPIAYIAAGPGVDLTSNVGKMVEVFGPAVYRGDIRTNHLTAMRVVPLQ
jgi:hypothetical protein